LRCTTPDEVVAGPDGLGDSTEHVVDVHTEQSGSSDSDSEDMEGVEEEGHDLVGDREQFADRESEELDNAFALELALATVVTETVESRDASTSGEEEVLEDAPKEDTHGERKRRSKRRGQRGSGSLRKLAPSTRAPATPVEPAAPVPKDSQLRKWFNDPYTRGVLYHGRYVGPQRGATSSSWRMK
jgi:hypothetical protein